MEFDHTAHVRLAWEMLSRQPLEDATEAVTERLIAITIEKGVPEKFDRALTEAWMQLVHARMQACSADWDTFRAQNEDIFARDFRLPR